MMLSLVTSLVVLACFSAVCYYINMVIFRKRRSGEPEIVKGSIILGNTVEFSTNAINFFLNCQRKYGGCFTIRLLNQFVTVVIDPHSYENVAREKNFDFLPIAKEVNRNVFGYGLKNPQAAIKLASTKVKGQYRHGLITAFVVRLHESCSTLDGRNGVEHASESGWVSDGLLHFTVITKFRAVQDAMFGTGPIHDQFNPEAIHKNFDEFDRYFNHFWLGLPKMMFPKGKSAMARLMSMPAVDELTDRADMCDFMRTSLITMKEEGSTETERKAFVVSFVHISHNTYRLCFWTLVNLLENNKALNALQQEVDNALFEKLCTDTNSATFSLAEIDSLKIMDSVLNETMRKASGVITVRYVMEDTWFTAADGKKYLFRKGDRVAMYPPATHMDPDIYEYPQEFQYDRFMDTTFYKNGKPLKMPVTVFGPQCPAIKAVLLMAKLYTMTMLTRYDMRLTGGKRAEYATEYQGHEVLPPRADVQFQYRVKADPPKILVAAV